MQEVDMRRKKDLENYFTGPIREMDQEEIEAVIATGDYEMPGIVSGRQMAEKGMLEFIKKISGHR